MKWLALIAMTCDHVNKVLLGRSLPLLSDFGRLALPLFVFVLACNLSRPGILERGAYGRIMRRLLFFGGLATLFYIADGFVMAFGWWPLNVMFTLLVLTAMLFCFETGRDWRGSMLFSLGGLLGEYWWPALLLGLSIWAYRQNPSWWGILSAALALAGIDWINGGQWTLLSVPAAALLCAAGPDLPRLKSVFYWYYPLHLSLLWVIRETAA
ncbi:MAG TPA: conjugal transfer protein TraX [Rhodobacteraceae bacterium]|nr:conjugal transfer protein TraX [Paracoccaceae bacterium]